MQTILYLKAHWHIIIGILIILGLAAAAYIDWQFFLLGLQGPRDTVGNGITVGLAKAFDNRSLSLRIERLSNSLAQLRVVDQKATESIGRLQGQSSALSATTLTLDAAAGNKPAASGTSQTPPATASASTVEPKSEFTLAASDILNEQLNLASQIMNLQTLYERSLTDRLFNDQARLQTVLGFQVSITPPAGFENSAAIVEVAVRMTPTSAKQSDRVSLVALIPQEKTYNAQSISTNSQSIGGSAVASVVTLGVDSKGESRQLFVHRDSDTVAFERKPTEEPRLLADGNATVFGWEFRPIFGRNTVSAGIRQMLAVIALPERDVSEDTHYVKVQIRTRTYWRRYDNTKQSSERKWHWFPQKIDGSGIYESKIQELAIPTTAKIHESLTPRIFKIDWFNSGDNRAIVIVKGENLFSGTRVLAGGQVYREEDGTLILKSDQTLEFETKLLTIVSGDAVLSGRFGRSLKLKADETLKLRGLYITKAVIKQSRRGRYRRLCLDVKGLDGNGDDEDLDRDILKNLPNPIVYIDDQPVPPPYEYWNGHPKQTAQTQSNPPSNTTAESAKPQEFTRGYPSTKQWLRVAAWIPSNIVITRSSLVRFRVPFCSFDFQSPFPLQFFEPTVTRIGGDGENSVFRISHSFGSDRKLRVELDEIYDKKPELEQIHPDEAEYKFTISNKKLAHYRYLALWLAGTEPYLIPIPEDKPKLVDGSPTVKPLRLQ